MNRRGFLGSITAAVVAAKTGLLSVVREPTQIVVDTEGLVETSTYGGVVGGMCISQVTVQCKNNMTRYTFDTPQFIQAGERVAIRLDKHHRPTLITYPSRLRS